MSRKDLAYLVKMDESNLARYEREERKPSVDIILTYHILFGKSLKELFPSKYENVLTQLFLRSQGLFAQFQTDSSPKSTKRKTYLSEIVNRLTEMCGYQEYVKENE